MFCGMDAAPLLSGMATLGCRSGTLAQRDALRGYQFDFFGRQLKLHGGAWFKRKVNEVQASSLDANGAAVLPDDTSCAVSSADWKPDKITDVNIFFSHRSLQVDFIYQGAAPSSV